jgi:hypothetical protein
VQVLLDTNIFYPDLRMQKTELRFLLDLSRQGYIRLLVPEVVIRETVNKYRERVVECERRLILITRELQDLSAPSMGVDLPEMEVEEAVQAYEQYLRSELQSANAEVLRIPRVAHNELEAIS